VRRKVTTKQIINCHRKILRFRLLLQVLVKITDTAMGKCRNVALVARMGPGTAIASK